MSGFEGADDDDRNLDGFSEPRPNEDSVHGAPTQNEKNSEADELAVAALASQVPATGGAAAERDEARAAARAAAATAGGADSDEDLGDEVPKLHRFFIRARLFNSAAFSTSTVLNTLRLFVF